VVFVTRLRLGEPLGACTRPPPSAPVCLPSESLLLHADASTSSPSIMTMVPSRIAVLHWHLIGSESATACTPLVQCAGSATALGPSKSLAALWEGRFQIHLPSRTPQPTNYRPLAGLERARTIDPLLDSNHSKSIAH
jgi:hypothetical protein